MLSIIEKNEIIVVKLTVYVVVDDVNIQLR